MKKILLFSSGVIGLALFIFATDRVFNFSEFVTNQNSQLEVCLSSTPLESCLAVINQSLMKNFIFTFWILFASLAIPLFTFVITSAIADRKQQTPTNS